MVNIAQDTELAARLMAHDCPVYAPRQGTDPSEALYNATRSGATSAACGERWFAARLELKRLGLDPLPAPAKSGGST